VLRMPCAPRLPPGPPPAPHLSRCFLRTCAPRSSAWSTSSSQAWDRLLSRDRSGGRLLGGLALLQDPDGVAERIADAHIGPVEMIGGFLGEVRDTPLLERLVESASIVGDEHEAAQRSLGDDPAQLGCGRFVMQRGPRLLQRDLGSRLARHSDAQPAVIALADVVALLDVELVALQVER